MRGSSHKSRLPSTNVSRLRRSGRLNNKRSPYAVAALAALGLGAVGYLAYQQTKGARTAAVMHSGERGAEIAEPESEIGYDRARCGVRDENRELESLSKETWKALEAKGAKIIRLRVGTRIQCYDLEKLYEYTTEHKTQGKVVDPNTGLEYSTHQIERIVAEGQRLRNSRGLSTLGPTERTKEEEKAESKKEREEAKEKKKGEQLSILRPIQETKEEKAENKEGEEEKEEKSKRKGEEEEAKDVVECIVGARKYAFWPIPSNERKLGYPRRTQAYFLSTGTSNTLGYAGMWFPTLGILEKGLPFGYMKRGWIQKESSHTTTPWRKKFCAMYDEYLEESVSDKERLNRIRCDDLYKTLLNYFRWWFQVQGSAVLGGEYWERPDLQYLRGLALTYDWNPLTNDFELREHPLKPQKVAAECTSIPSRPSVAGSKSTLPTDLKIEDTNNVFASKGALGPRSVSDVLQWVQDLEPYAKLMEPAIEN